MEKWKGNSIGIRNLPGTTGCKPRFTGSTKRLLIASVVIVSIALGTPISYADTHKEQKWAKGRVLVQPRTGLSADELEKVVKPHGGKSTEYISGINVHVISLPEEASETAVARALSKNPHVKFAELDQLIPLSETTANDAYFSKAWHLSKMQAPGAWDLSRGDSVIVAVLDTGVDPDHPDLAQQLVSGWNIYDNNSDASDVYGHGTKVAGTVAALSNNGIGVTSIAWDAQIMPVRISRPDGYAYFSTIASGITWAADHGAKVANVSYGASGSSSVQSAARYFKSKGGLVIVSAGNSGTYDATLESDALISVSATNSTDVRASWSSYGAYVDVAAPGEGIWTTSNGGGYASVSGTSFSSPAAAGVVALMMAANPALEPSQIEEILESTVDDLGDQGYDVHYGYGRVNAFEAVLTAAQTTVSDTQAPSVAIASPQGGIVSGVVSVDISASDNVGVTQVELYANGALVASDNISPYAFSWDSTAVQDGSVSLIAYARDAAGNWGSSTTVMVTVDNIPDPVDGAPPVVAIMNPADGAKITSTTVVIDVSAADETSIYSIKLYIDGKQAATSSTTSLSYSWNTKKLRTGSHTIRAIAADKAGNTAQHTIQVYK